MADWRTTPWRYILIAISEFERFGIIDKLNYFRSLILNFDMFELFWLCSVFLFPCIFYLFYVLRIFFKQGGS